MPIPSDIRERVADVIESALLNEGICPPDGFAAGDLAPASDAAILATLRAAREKIDVGSLQFQSDPDARDACCAAEYLDSLIREYEGE